jgi:hypothetical protein
MGWEGHTVYSALGCKTRRKKRLEDVRIDAETKKTDIFSFLYILDMAE